LVVVLVIDQFRPDQLTRFEERFLPAVDSEGAIGGFRYLLERGALYPFAEYGILQNMTGPGHATILSGAYPYQHGIANNDWVDGETGETVNCIADSRYPIVGADKGAELKGASPRYFQGTTWSDELKNSGYPNRVVSISLKDRSSILLGGHRADLALWFDTKAMNWVSSRYYLPDGRLPDWLNDMNQAIARDKDKILRWEVNGAGSGTSIERNTHVALHRGSEALKADFPHEIKAGARYALLLPYGTELTMALAEKLIDTHKLGQSQGTDLLAISLSNHDATSHSYGPNSRQVEELTVTEDRQISRLLRRINREIGLDKTLVVLTSDHGAPPNPDWLQSVKVPAGRLGERDIREKGEAFLQKNFGKPAGGQWIFGISDLNIYLNQKAIRAAKLDLAKVQDALAQYYREARDLQQGVAHVFSGADVRRRTLPPHLWEQQILKTYIAGRSGDVVLIPRPHYIVTSSSTTHISGYAYDRIVPIIFSGPGIKPGLYGQKAEVVDIAPTLSFLTGTIPPSGSEGRILHEMLDADFKAPFRYPNHAGF
jgi:predicted AlkP superfamily pyrophosphatase or phosphodiesterase